MMRKADLCSSRLKGYITGCTSESRSTAIFPHTDFSYAATTRHTYIYTNTHRIHMQIHKNTCRNTYLHNTKHTNMASSYAGTAWQTDSAYIHTNAHTTRQLQKLSTLQKMHCLYCYTSSLCTCLLHCVVAQCSCRHLKRTRLLFCPTAVRVFNPSVCALAFL